MQRIESIINVISSFLFKGGNMLNIVCIIFSLVIIYFLGKILEDKMKEIKDRSLKYLKPPEGINEKEWRDAFIIRDELQVNTKCIGLLERFVFYFSMVISQPSIIGFWLAFKVASKWQAWQNISKIPDYLSKNHKTSDKNNTLGQFKARNIIATYTLQRWFLGTLGNIAIAAIVYIPYLLLIQ